MQVIRTEKDCKYKKILTNIYSQQVKNIEPEELSLS